MQTLEQLITIQTEVFNLEKLDIYNNDGDDEQTYYHPLYLGKKKPSNLNGEFLKWYLGSTPQQLRIYLWKGIKTAFWDKEDAQLTDAEKSATRIWNLANNAIAQKEKVSISSMGIVTPILLIESESYQPHAVIVLRAANFLSHINLKRQDLTAGKINYSEYSSFLNSFGISRD